MVLKLIDITGKVVLNEEVISGSDYSLKRGNLNPGMYTIELLGENIYHKRIVIN